MVLHIRIYFICENNLHGCPVHWRKSTEFPEQLLFKDDAVGCWQVRDLSCRPAPHVEVHVVQADQPVHPIAPEQVNQLSLVIVVHECIHT